jgi:hypothetical protein
MLVKKNGRHQNFGDGHLLNLINELRIHPNGLLRLNLAVQTE